MWCSQLWKVSGWGDFSRRRIPKVVFLLENKWAKSWYQGCYLELCNALCFPPLLCVQLFLFHLTCGQAAHGLTLSQWWWFLWMMSGMCNMWQWDCSKRWTHHELHLWRLLSGYSKQCSWPTTWLPTWRIRVSIWQHWQHWQWLWALLWLVDHLGQCHKLAFALGTPWARHANMS